MYQRFSSFCWAIAMMIKINSMEPNGFVFDEQHNVNWSNQRTSDCRKRRQQWRRGCGSNGAFSADDSPAEDAWSRHFWWAEVLEQELFSCQKMQKQRRRKSTMNMWVDWHHSWNATATSRLKLAEWSWMTTVECYEFPIRTLLASAETSMRHAMGCYPQFRQCKTHTSVKYKERTHRNSHSRVEAILFISFEINYSFQTN